MLAARQTCWRRATSMALPHIRRASSSPASATARTAATTRASATLPPPVPPSTTTPFIGHRKSTSRRHWLYIFPGICFGLCAWQVYRLQWKNRLVATMQERLDAPAQELHAPWEYADRITVRGRFLHAWEQLVGPRNRGGPGKHGYYVYTPLLTEDGALLFVNRGWIPLSHVEQRAREELSATEALPKGTVTITGMLRQPKFYQPTNLFLLPEARTPSHGGHMLERPRWMWADVEAMMREVRGELASTTVADKVNTAVTDFFVEEVLDWSEEEEGANEDEGSTTREPSETTADMLSWHRADASLAHAQSTLPPMLAALRALQADPRTFHGKPIVGVAAVNVNNKHEGYAYTWASLGGLLAGWIWLSGRGRGRGGGRR